MVINSIGCFTNFKDLQKGADMKKSDIKNIKTKGDAIQLAIDWQNLISTKAISYAELAEYTAEFTLLARKFGLVREFKENGII
jgi:hypothetical protein